MKSIFYIVLLALLTIGCQNPMEKQQIANPADYNNYLDTSIKVTLEEAQTTAEFWSKRLRPDSSGVGDLGPLAGTYEQLFQQTGDVSFLKSAEKLYLKGTQISANNKDVYIRGLAHNYVSQHRFKEAYEILQQSLKGVSNKHQTKLMLFDVAMEVGDYEAAYEYLKEVTDLSDYNYLIRLSKWSDYKGNLEDAIKYMEKAKKIADSRDSKPLKIWTYSNLGDYYGHAGRIADAYRHYLMTLELQPDNAYVKKGLAWIVYAQDGDTNEAHRILDSVMVNHPLPDYHLFKSELYEYDGMSAKAEIEMKTFIETIENGDYGAMYNNYLIEYYAETAPQKALDLAKKELENRRTPEVYHLLALAQLKNDNPELALQIIQDYVKSKTSEPMALYHSALVYKANNLYDDVQPIKEELEEAAFELGPVLMKEIRQL
ncbi:MAG: tetratricopeptide repeat protein [Flavobacteriaceae bacterium]|nr:tetratricopeptide repeat protein [Flavobacteriaceae bacterium]